MCIRDSSQYVFEDPDLAITCVSGGIAAGGLEFGHGFELYLEEATIMFDAGTLDGDWVVNTPLRLITNDGVNTPELNTDSEWCGAFTAELQTAVDAVNSGTESRILSGGLARDALRMCFAEARSIASGAMQSI